MKLGKIFIKNTDTSNLHTIKDYMKAKNEFINNMIYSEYDNLRELGNDLTELTTDILDTISTNIDSDIDYEDLEDVIGYVDDLIFEYCE